jgi:putative transcriptional regulator
MAAVESLAGQLLVATPSTGGAIFRRSVVLLLQHDDTGAHGLVLNKPLATGVQSVLPSWQEHVSRPQRLFQGGPVGLDTALGLAFAPGGDEPQLGIQRVFGALGVVDLDAPPELIMPEVTGLRIFAGYAGWAPGQLEGEIAEGGWYVVPSADGDVFSDRPEGLWSAVLRRQPGQLSWVASFPEDPSWN